MPDRAEDSNLRAAQNVEIQSLPASESKARSDNRPKRGARTGIYGAATAASVNTMTTTNDSTRLAGIVLLALVALFALPALFGMAGLGGGMPMGWGGGWMHDTWMHGGTGGTVPWWMWGMGLLGQLLVLAVIVAGGVLLFRALRDGSDGGDTALGELRRAYARGDIDDEEFDRRRERLERD